jgi:sialidase-1
VNIPGSNESTAAELSNNGLLMNARNQNGEIKSRLIAISHNGGANWDTTYFDTQLPDPVCEGSILNIGVKDKKQVLAFVNAADTKNRNNLTLRISFDEGKTWPEEYRKVISNFRGKDSLALAIAPWQRTTLLTRTKGQHEGYFSSEQTPDGTIYLTDGKIVYTFNLAWLME